MWRTDAFWPVLVDVGIGNIESVERALNYLGLRYGVASEPAALLGATHICLPGVGAFKAGMQALIAHDMVMPIKDIVDAGAARILGICLGMQLLGQHSEEGHCVGLGLLPFAVEHLRPDNVGELKIPHVGFNTVQGYLPTGLFHDLPTQADFYFTHSFGVYDLATEANIGVVNYGGDIVATFDAGAVCGAQFHPEKSQSNGLRLLHNFFLDLTSG